MKHNKTATNKIDGKDANNDDRKQARRSPYAAKQINKYINADLSRLRGNIPDYDDD